MFYPHVKQALNQDLQSGRQKTIFLNFFVSGRGPRLTVERSRDSEHRFRLDAYRTEREGNLCSQGIIFGVILCMILFFF